MIELPLVFISGALGSAHCVGMCGPFALTIGSGAPRLTANLQRQLVYSAGRVSTYAFLGALAGYGGWRLTTLSSAAWINAQAVLAILAGALLVAQGLLAAGVRPRFWRRRSAAVAAPCLASGALATFLQSPGLSNVFLAGVLTGFLPCGLVYAFLALATSAGHVGLGLLTMIAFGLGTMPVMVLTGCGGTLMTLSLRRRVFQAAAWCVVVAGMMSIARGAGFLDLPGWHEPTGCPACQSAHGPLDGQTGGGQQHAQHQ